ncbi:MAG TPA: hypothetical protein VF430_07655 [Verrucomicrobiae bacterium]|jgi:Skp family chaperone for outer membrane proteins
MKRTSLLAILSAALLVFILGRENAAAQNFPNFDPQQIQQMIKQVQQRFLTSLRDQMEVTNDTEWNAMEPLLNKVVQAETESMISGMGGMGMIRMFMGNRGGNIPSLGQSDPEGDALQKLLDDGAPTRQIRDALARYNDARKRKADELTRNREQLRKILTPRQEAILVLSGLLD